MTPRSTFPDPMEIWNHLEQHVRGQEHAKREIAVAVYNHYLNQHLFPEISPVGQHLLLAGPEGVGKTFLVRKTADFLGIPWIHVDASSLVQPALSGQALQGITDALLHKTGGDLKLAQHGIVLIDRLDHCLRSSSSPGDPGIAVQDAIVTLMDGVVLRHKEEPVRQLDTSRLLFICSGNFDWLQTVVTDRLDENSKIGFQIDEDPTESTHIRDLIQKSDLVALGLGEELASRFNKVSILNQLTTEDLVHLLKEMKDGALPQKIHFWATHGIELNFTEDALAAIAEKAQEAGDGARGLSGVLEKVLDPIDHLIVAIAKQGVHRVEFTKEHIETGSSPIRITKADAKKDQDVDLLLESVWSGFQSLPSKDDNFIPVESAIQAMPLPNVIAALEQLELSMGRLSLTSDQDKTWRAIRREHAGEGHRVLLQLLARVQQANASLSYLCDSIQKSSGDLLAALKGLEDSQR